mmetsp:Transcript_64643/g.192597  ORF Transcript_64643/g.192597 Transcript_64643/m.192597 type:complete len:314 (-) Transcript_64643:247-1188(-)
MCRGAVVAAVHDQLGVVLPVGAVLPERLRPLPPFAEGEAPAPVAASLRDVVEDAHLEGVLTIVQLEASVCGSCPVDVVRATIHLGILLLLLQPSGPPDVGLAGLRARQRPGGLRLLRGRRLGAPVPAEHRPVPLVLAPAAVADAVVHRPEPHDVRGSAPPAVRPRGRGPAAREAGQRRRGRAHATAARHKTRAGRGSWLVAAILAVAVVVVDHIAEDGEGLAAVKTSEAAGCTLLRIAGLRGSRRCPANLAAVAQLEAPPGGVSGGRPCPVVSLFTKATRQPRCGPSRAALVQETRRMPARRRGQHVQQQHRG